jgi:hypothetical protein
MWARNGALLNQDLTCNRELQAEGHRANKGDGGYVELIVNGNQGVIALPVKELCGNVCEVRYWSEVDRQSIHKRRLSELAACESASERMQQKHYGGNCNDKYEVLRGER